MSEQLILIEGLSASGKSLSLSHLNEPEGVIYLNCENKRLPFKPGKLQCYNITDPYQVYEGIEYASKTDAVHTVVIDTLDFLMTMFETNIIKKAVNGQKAWGDYFTYFQELMQVHIANSSKQFIILAHSHTVLDEEAMMKTTSVPVKGALRNLGVESFFTTVVMAKQVPLRIVEPYKNPMLNVSEDDKERGVKYVFQTRMTKESAGEKIRSPQDMWTKDETFIDNNIQYVLDRLADYYK
jgi:AAA domain